ncbi:H-NS histone, partial [Pseudomonas sp. MWU12-2534b]
LMGEYSKSLRDIIALLDPESKTKGTRGAAVKTTGTKRARKVKQYKNPHNGEVIETKGGNHKTLKEWKAKWGGDVVEGWATLLG